MNSQKDADLKFLRETHLQGKLMGLDDEEIIRIAKTNGAIDPDAMTEYLQEHDD